MEISDDFFKKVEKRTNVNKESLLSVASKLNESNMKDEKTLRNIIQELAGLANKDVSAETENKIIDLILNDKVPKSVDKMF